MPAVHVRHIPEEVLAALRERAARHHRSMQQELLGILKEAAAEVPPAAVPGPISLVKVRTEGTTTWRREEEYGDQGR